MLALTDPAIRKTDARAAAVLLEPAVTYMLSRGETYVVGDLTKRAQFYLALALLETLDDTRREYAFGLFTSSVKAGFVPPGHLLRRAIEAFVFSGDDERATRAAELALQELQLRGRLLGSLLTAEVARRSPAVWEALFSWANSDSRSRQRRFSDVCVLLREAVKGERPDLGAQALDVLEALATEGACRNEFIELLTATNEADPAWNPSECRWAAIHMLELSGRYAEAADLLAREFHQRLWSHDPEGRDEAADILQRITGYPLADNTLAGLKAAFHRYEEANATPVSISAAASDIPVRVTVVGGDEMQARFDEQIRRDVHESLTGVDLHFRHTNWSSNWGDQFEDMKPLLDRSDAVVVMRLIRTNLGRTIRRHCPLWVGCSGHGHKSIERAIATAVTIAREAK